MERIRALIDKLQQQAGQQGDIAAMLVTVQLLQAELTKASAASYTPASSKISVVLPGGNRSYYAEPAPVAEPDIKKPEKAAQQAETAMAATYGNGNHENYRPALSIPEKVSGSAWMPDPVAEIPSLIEQRKEMNEVLGQPALSINDKLKTERTELGSMHTESPVKDLKKAIGINDRFVFLHELFRGDETMYERSIKTINNFRAYPEAEYWIERELQIKLGWDEKKESVRYFRQLVKRRFF